MCVTCALFCSRYGGCFGRGFGAQCLSIPPGMSWVPSNSGGVASSLCNTPPVSAGCFFSNAKSGDESSKSWPKKVAPPGEEIFGVEE